MNDVKHRPWSIFSTDPLVKVFSVTGPEGFFQPGPVEQCLTRDAAASLVIDFRGHHPTTGIDPVLYLGIRMQERLLAFGVDPIVAAVTCQAMQADVTSMLILNGVHGQIGFVKVKDRRWSATGWSKCWPTSAEWGDSSLFHGRGGDTDGMVRKVNALIAQRDKEKGYE